MSERSWQVRIGSELSKPYSRRQLGRKHASGLIGDRAECTFDGGATFVPLLTILDDDAASPAERGPRNGRSRKSRTTSQPAVVAGNEQNSSPGQSPRNAARANRSSPEPASAAASRTALLDLVAQVATDVPVAALPDDNESAEIYSLSVQSDDDHDDRSQAQELDQVALSPIARAAAQALACEEKARQAEQHTGPADHAVSAPVSRPVQDNAQTSSTANFMTTLIRRPVAVLTICLGLGAAGTLTMWYVSSDGPPGLEELLGDATAIETFSYNGDVTMDALNARTQILAVRVNQMARVLTDGEHVLEPVEVQELSVTPAFPMVPFEQRTLSSVEQAKVDDYFARYSRLVNEKGPSGRSIDGTTTDIYTGYLAYLISTVDSRGAKRADALHELSELIKLVYLLQLKNIDADESGARQKAIGALRSAAQDGLATVFPEIANGDMRFTDVFLRSDAAEQARLLIIRYWCYRAANRQTADAWLSEAMELVDVSERQVVTDSIAEADTIERQ